MTWQNNVLVATTNEPFQFLNPAFVADPPTTLGNNLWFAKAGGVTTPTWDPSALTANPQFQADGTDFALRVTSPARSAGKAGVGPSYDMVGKVRPSPPAIGAFEER